MFVVGTVPAFFGCLLPPCLFSIAKKMGMSNSVAFLVGSLSVFDSMEVVESRHILVDSQLMFYCGLSLWFALKYWDALERVGCAVWLPVPLSGMLQVLPCSSRTCHRFKS